MISHASFWVCTLYIIFLIWCPMKVLIKTFPNNIMETTIEITVLHLIGKLPLNGFGLVIPKLRKIFVLYSKWIPWCISQKWIPGSILDVSKKLAVTVVSWNILWKTLFSICLTTTTKDCLKMLTNLDWMYQNWRKVLHSLL